MSSDPETRRLAILVLDKMRHDSEMTPDEIEAWAERLASDLCNPKWDEEDKRVAKLFDEHSA